MRVAALLRERGVEGSRGAYPGANLKSDDVFARLILVSILEGSTTWAQAGLRDYAAAYPDAAGRLAGREANYAEALTALLQESTEWPPVVESAIRREIDGLAGIEDKAGHVAMALNLARTLDRPVAVAQHPSATARLMELMAFLRKGGSKKRGKLAAVKDMTGG